MTRASLLTLSWRILVSAVAEKHKRGSRNCLAHQWFWWMSTAIQQVLPWELVATRNWLRPQVPPSVSRRHLLPEAALNRRTMLNSLQKRNGPRFSLEARPAPPKPIARTWLRGERNPTPKVCNCGAKYYWLPRSPSSRCSAGLWRSAHCRRRSGSPFRRRASTSGASAAFALSVSLPQRSITASSRRCMVHPMRSRR